MKDIIIAAGIIVLLAFTVYFAKDSLTVLLPLLTAIISAAFAYYFSKKKELDLKISEEKRVRYEKLILQLKRGFFDRNLPDNEKIRNKDEYYEQSYIVWLYASDEVIKNLNSFARSFSDFCNRQSAEYEADVRKAMGKLVLSMRKDIRGSTILQEDDFITTNIK
jgi:hypothetical protein